MTLLCINNLGGVASGAVEAMILEDRPQTDVTNEYIGILYSDTAVQVRCNKSYPKLWTTVSTPKGHQAVMVGDFLSLPVDDYPALVEYSVQKNTEFRLVPTPLLGNRALFFSTNQIQPTIYDAVIELLVSKYSQVPDVLACIRDWEVCESKNADLAINPASKNILAAANVLVPHVGSWFRVNAESENGRADAVVHLGQQLDSSTFKAMIYCPFQGKYGSGMVLVRKAISRQSPLASFSRDLMRLKEISVH